MYRPILISILLALSLGSCATVRHFEVQAIGQDFDRKAKEAHTLFKTIRDDFTQKRMALHSLKKQNAKMTAPPYAQLAIIIDSLEIDINKAEKHSKGLAETYSQFRTKTKGRVKISSKSSDYQRVKNLQGRADELVSALEDIVEDYEDNKEDVEAFMALSQITQIDVPKTRVQLNQFLRNLDTRISLFRSRASKVQAHSLGKSRATYQKISKQLARIERERGQFSKIVAQFNRDANDQAKLWIGPGVFMFDMMSKCEHQAQNIRKIGDEISEQARLLEP